MTAGCSLFQKPDPVIVTKTVTLPILQPTLPRKINLYEPTFYVVSEKNLDKFLKEMERKSDNMVFFAMTVADYELMAFNMQEIKRYVQQTGDVILYYHNAVEKNNEESK